MPEYSFFSRDLSWLTFNGRVLQEAHRSQVPLLERIRFLSIFSSNLDEFYRVRMPVLRALRNDEAGYDENSSYDQARQLINAQQSLYGKIIIEDILPQLLDVHVDWLYNKAIPNTIAPDIDALFESKIKALIQVIPIDLGNKDFFAENNKLYQGVFTRDQAGNENLYFINVPVSELSRLFEIRFGNLTYIVFLEDIIRHKLDVLFPAQEILGAYNIKVTRDAEMRVEDEVDANIIAALERELAKRDLGPATRFLCQPGVPLRHLYKMVYVLNLQQASIVLGGNYHNLKDLGQFPFRDAALEYPKWPPADAITLEPQQSLFEWIRAADILVHVPYERFEPVLDFFRSAAIDPQVTEVYCTLYRVADNSSIVRSLIQAAENGKKVVVMLELKARFDEANNIKWANELKSGGVKIIYSNSSFKVHAKVALVKRIQDNKLEYFGLLSTGNMNESTARFYTDHMLLTAYEPMLKELETLFGFLGKKKKMPSINEGIDFKHLLVAQFNLQSTFLELIDREIEHARQGLPASILIKLNNLEEKVLISKLYDASNAGVQIHLIVRSICCLIPGVPGQSENIVVKRIVDRFLEHGRVFLFHNNGEEKLYMGSADWMNRNIYSRIEVCFPIYDQELKNNLKQILLLQWQDTAQAVYFTSEMENVPVGNGEGLRSQEEIYKRLQRQTQADKI